jgi:hypothetical protein
MAWCKIDENLISNLVNIIGDKKVLEVCAGKGELAAELINLNINIKATGKLQSSYDGDNPILHCDIEDIDSANAVRKYKDDFDLILVSWAIADDSFLQAAILFNKPIIFIGELYHKHKLNPFGFYSGNASDNYFENTIDLIEPIQLEKGYLSFHQLKNKISLLENINLNFYPWNNKITFKKDIENYNKC